MLAILPLSYRGFNRKNGTAVLPDKSLCGTLRQTSGKWQTISHFPNPPCGVKWSTLSHRRI
jgi:hypothetical protein